MPPPRDIHDFVAAFFDFIFSAAFYYMASDIWSAYRRKYLRKPGATVASSVDAALRYHRLLVILCAAGVVLLIILSMFVNCFVHYGLFMLTVTFLSVTAVVLRIALYIESRPDSDSEDKKE
jgi:hypothetical protein